MKSIVRTIAICIAIVGIESTCFAQFETLQCDDVGCDTKTVTTKKRSLFFTLTDPLLHKAKSLCKKKCEPAKESHIHIDLTAEQLHQLVPTVAETPSTVTSATATAAAEPVEFAVPPPTGSTVDRSTAWGFGGGAITLPEMRIGLPSIEMPHLLRIRRGRSMRIDPAEATIAAPSRRRPQIQQPIPAHPAVAVATIPQDYFISPVHATRTPTTASATRAIDEIESLKNNLVAKQKLLEKKLAEVDQMMNQLQDKHNASRANTTLSPSAIDPVKQVPSRPSYQQLPAPHRLPSSCDDAPGSAAGLRGYLMPHELNDK